MFVYNPSPSSFIPMVKWRKYETNGEQVNKHLHTLTTAAFYDHYITLENYSEQNSWRNCWRT